MNSTTQTMNAGWTQGSAKRNHSFRLYHCFTEATNLSLCRRVTRDSTNEVVKSPDVGTRCAKCNERANNIKPGPPARRHCANQ